MFSEVKKNLGFGCMRMKMNGDEIDYAEFSSMVDMFIEGGFNYFDTAHGYIGQKSEIAVRDCVVKRHPRENFVLANKLSAWYIEKEEDILPFFENQLERCGVDYFDFYLLHALNRKTYEKHKNFHSFDILRKLKEEGKIKHIAISFHDTAEVLDMILSNEPDIEAVQIQFNYLDYDDPGVQSKACYDVCVKHGKKIMVMEPVKGGALVNLPKEAEEYLSTISDKTPAAYALSFVASFPEIFMVLSGMGDCSMVSQNMKTMDSTVPLTEKEKEGAEKLRKIIRQSKIIPCTGCNYCGEVCPKKIPVPGIFSSYNNVVSAKNALSAEREILPEGSERVLECIDCGKCEEICPQNLPIRKLLSAAKDMFF